MILSFSVIMKTGDFMFGARKKNLQKIDRILLITFGILLIYGLLILNSATLSIEGNLLRSQLISTGIGLFLLMIILLIDIDLIKKLYIPIYIFSMALLLLVFFFGVGQEEWGANSWLVIGPVSFQASEIAKIGIILSLGRILEDNHEKLNKPKILLKVLILAALPILLVMSQPDMGTAFVMIFIVLVMLFTAGLHLNYFLGAVVAGIASLPFIYLRLDKFQKNRILNFLHPERDVSDTGYQAMQSKIAIGSGKLSGKGLNKGIQNQYNFIPEKQTDFIFAVVSEELGFLGGVFLILLYGILLYRFLHVANKTASLYQKLIIMGIFAMFLFHIFENIGMSIGLVPITGIPLPFFSYGGTFQITNIICLGIVLSASIQREPLSFE